MDDVAIVANPRAAGGGARSYAARLARRLETSGIRNHLRFTARPGEATHLVREAVKGGAAVVLAIGGDGTLNEVVNGFFEDDRRIPSDTALAIAQVGTGKDFSRTVRQSARPDEVIDRLSRAQRKRIDMGRVSYMDLRGRPASRYFVNIAEFGSGGAVVEKVNRTTKVLGGRTSFFLAILSTLPKYRNTHVRYRVEAAGEGELVMNNFVVANGRYFGGGLLPAPQAELDDGLFDIVVIGDIDWKTIRRHLKDLRRGTHLSMKEVTFHHGARVETECLEPAFLDLDGELVGRNPTEFVCLPRTLDLLV